MTWHWGRRTFDLRWRGWRHLFYASRATNDTWLAWKSAVQIGPLAWITWKRVTPIQEEA